MARTLDSVLQQHIAGLPGVHVALIGNGVEGTALAAINYSEADTNEIAAFATDLLRANVRFCHVFDPGTPVDFVGAGSKDNKLLVRSIPNSVYFVVFVVASGTNMKEVVYRVRAATQDSQRLLPEARKQEKSTAQALIDYAKRYAPDPTFIMLRLSLKTGVPPERLEEANLKESEVNVLYDSIKDILGVDRLPVSL